MAVRDTSQEQTPRHGGNTPEVILETVADAMVNLGCLTLGQSVVEHPIGSRTLPEIQTRAQDSYQQAVNILTR